MSSSALCTTCANGADLSAVAGYCVSPVVMRCEVSGQESFTELVGRMGSVVTDALNDVVPFETLVAALGVSRNPGSNPLFQTALALHPPLSSPADDWSLNLVESDVSDAVGSSKFDISIELDERPEGHVAGRLFFSADLFDRETAREMALQWCRLLDAVAAEPEIPMAEHDLVTPDERERQLGWNLTTQQCISSTSQCVHEVISSQVERTPDAAAVQVGDKTLTYRQLDDRASAIASRLVQAGAGTGTVVAVLLDRTPDLVAAVLGILKSGAAFLPLDPRQPTARNSFCINDADANIVLTDHQLPPAGRAQGHRHQPRRLAADAACRCPVKHRVSYRPRLRDLHVRLHRSPKGRAHRASQRDELDADHVSRVWRRGRRHRAVGVVHQL